MELSRREREQLERENYIISKSIELFFEYGFENVSMDQIAKESEFTKRTVYRYFQSKEDLYFAAALQGHQSLYKILKEAQSKGDTGYEKLRSTFYAYYDYCKTYPSLAQLVNKRQYSKIQNEDITSPFYKKFLEVDQLIFDEMRQLFESGIADKSIRFDMDIEYLTYTTIFSVVSFFHLYTFTGKSFTSHLNLDNDKFVSFTIEQMLDQIKAK
jgi:AcrR family transcriptional regulator